MLPRIRRAYTPRNDRISWIVHDSGPVICRRESNWLFESNRQEITGADSLLSRRGSVESIAHEQDRDKIAIQARCIFFRIYFYGFFVTMRLYGYFCERRLLEYCLSFVRRLGNRFFEITRCISKRLLLFISSVSVLYFSEAVKIVWFYRDWVVFHEYFISFYRISQKILQL